jgi:hypothetical protein
MQVSQTHFSSEDVYLMGRVCEDAWTTMKSKGLLGGASEFNARCQMAGRVLRAVAGGQRDPEILKSIALAGAITR